MWIALPPSTQNLAMDSPARHRGSSMSFWFSMMLRNCSQPLPARVLSKMTLKRDWRLPISARVSSSNCAGLWIGLGGAIGPMSLAKSSNEIGAVSFINVTVAPPLKLVVLGIRNTRAASAGTAGSPINLCLAHCALNASATGNHLSFSTASVSGQYTCQPRPEFTIVGRGKLIALHRSLSACIPVA